VLPAATRVEGDAMEIRENADAFFARVDTRRGVGIDIAIEARSPEDRAPEARATKTEKLRRFLSGASRGERIRTSDPLTPSQVR
jgi:hypothetical protein